MKPQIKLTFLKDIEVAPMGGTVELEEYPNGFVELWIRSHGFNVNENVINAKKLYEELKNYFENKPQENN